MGNPKSPKPARSPVTSKVLATLLTELRADSEIEAGLCDRLEVALAPGATINAASLKEAIFPTQKAAL